MGKMGLFLCKTCQSYILSKNQLKCITCCNRLSRCNVKKVFCQKKIKLSIWLNNLIAVNERNQLEGSIVTGWEGLFIDWEKLFADEININWIWKMQESSSSSSTWSQKKYILINRWWRMHWPLDVDQQEIKFCLMEKVFVTCLSLNIIYFITYRE